MRALVALVLVALALVALALVALALAAVGCMLYSALKKTCPRRALMMVVPEVVRHDPATKIVYGHCVNALL
jgi:hypothetical protein